MAKRVAAPDNSPPSDVKALVDMMIQQQAQFVPLWNDLLHNGTWFKGSVQSDTSFEDKQCFNATRCADPKIHGDAYYGYVVQNFDGQLFPISHAWRVKDGVVHEFMKVMGPDLWYFGLKIPQKEIDLLWEAQTPGGADVFDAWRFLPKDKKISVRSAILRANLER